VLRSGVFSTDKAQSLGAKLQVPPTDIPNIGRFSVLSDPQGATFALFQTTH
jgi:predicted enzyme related to lactoylglutathione lyase